MGPMIPRYERCSLAFAVVAAAVTDATPPPEEEETPFLSESTRKRGPKNNMEDIDGVWKYSFRNLGATGREALLVLAQVV